ncbi:MAG: dTDP-4-dehydrorhamnose 3,5-epimerase [Syntrophomonadaceae bacterium]|nr:dTDP-4-dehydrorhamnose 3,5-epimerase [Syntrophomonadaceae bacterium]
MEITATEIPDVLLIRPDVHRDGRGYFMETWNAERYRQAGLPAVFVQDNLSFSRQGVLRGLHYQHPVAQGKLVQVLVGEVFDVAVDIRRGSPTFGRWVGRRLSGDNHLQLYIPEGFAHGFCVLSPCALLAYKCTAPYDPEGQAGVCWQDPELAIEWPVAVPLLSEADRSYPALRQVPVTRLPRYGGAP